MKHLPPQGFSRRRVQQLLAKTKSESSVGGRILVLSRQFLGCPYSSSLIGSRTQPEVFVASLDGFDCVTYVETILALSRSSTPEEFGVRLKSIRYENGAVQWRRRNHYMTQWIRRNKAGKTGLRTVAPGGVPKVVKERTLDDVPDYPKQNVRFECVPKPGIRKLAPYLQTGDLIFFASTRPKLDVFHCGILVRDGERFLMRHASRSKGGVVEQNLNEFLKANRMAGVIVVRP